MKRLLIIVTVFLIGFGTVIFNSYHETENILDNNTSYNWNTIKKSDCLYDDTFDSCTIMETTGKEFKIYLYYKNDELVETNIIARDEYIGELDTVASELNVIYDNAFWYVW